MEFDFRDDPLGVNPYQLWRVRKVLLNRIKAFGYFCPDIPYDTYEEFKENYLKSRRGIAPAKSMSRFYTPITIQGWRENNVEDKIIVLFTLEEKLNVKAFQEIVAYPDTPKMSSIWVVSRQGFTKVPTHIKSVAVNVFLWRNLIVDITENNFVPKHEKADAKVIEDLGLNKLTISEINLQDPALQFFRCKKGDIIQICPKEDVFEKTYRKVK